MSLSQVEPTAEEEVGLAVASEAADWIELAGDVTAGEDRRRARDKRRDGNRQEAIAEGGLLEGPQLPDAAVSQDDIDSLFDSL